VEAVDTDVVRDCPPQVGRGGCFDLQSFVVESRVVDTGTEMVAAALSAEWAEDALGCDNNWSKDPVAKAGLE
jgi:hypothetical protein